MLHQRVSPETLGCARIWVFGIWLVSVLLTPFSDLARFPVEILRPIGVLQLIPPFAWPALLSPAGVLGLKIALLAGVALLVLGLPGYRLTALLTCALLTFYQGLIRGFTFTNHGELPLLYTAWVLALFPAADALALGPRRGPARAPVIYSAAMQLCALVLLLCYSLVGVRRLVESAPGIFLDGTIIHYVAVRAAASRGTFGDLGLAVLQHPGLARAITLGFPVIGLCEALAPFCLVSRWFRLVWLPVMVAFHLGVWMLMGFLFLFNLLMIPVFLTEVDRLVARLPVGIRGRAARLRPPATSLTPPGAEA
jgi:hypothetical protein